MRGQDGRESADFSSTWPPNRHQPHEMFINIRRGEVASVGREAQRLTQTLGKWEAGSSSAKCEVT
jgi:hypothetical protein